MRLASEESRGDVGSCSVTNSGNSSVMIVAVLLIIAFGPFSTQAQGDFFFDADQNTVERSAPQPHPIEASPRSGTRDRNLANDRSSADEQEYGCDFEEEREPCHCRDIQVLQAPSSESCPVDGRPNPSSVSSSNSSAFPGASSLLSAGGASSIGTSAQSPRQDDKAGREEEDKPDCPALVNLQKEIEQAAQEVSCPTKPEQEDDVAAYRRAIAKLEKVSEVIEWAAIDGFGDPTCDECQQFVLEKLSLETRQELEMIQKVFQAQLLLQGKEYDFTSELGDLRRGTEGLQLQADQLEDCPAANGIADVQERQAELERMSQELDEVLEKTLPKDVVLSREEFEDYCEARLADYKGEGADDPASDYQQFKTLMQSASVPYVNAANRLVAAIREGSVPGGELTESMMKDPEFMRKLVEDLPLLATYAPLQNYLDAHRTFMQEIVSWRSKHVIKERQGQLAYLNGYVGREEPAAFNRLYSELDGLLKEHGSIRSAIGLSGKPDAYWEGIVRYAAVTGVAAELRGNSSCDHEYERYLASRADAKTRSSTIDGVEYHQQNAKRLLDLAFQARDAGQGTPIEHHSHPSALKLLEELRWMAMELYHRNRMITAQFPSEQDPSMPHGASDAFVPTLFAEGGYQLLIQQLEGLNSKDRDKMMLTAQVGEDGVGRFVLADLPAEEVSATDRDHISGWEFDFGTSAAPNHAPAMMVTANEPLAQREKGSPIDVGKWFNISSLDPGRREWLAGGKTTMVAVSLYGQPQESEPTTFNFMAVAGDNEYVKFGRDLLHQPVAPLGHTSDMVYFFGRSIYAHPEREDKKRLVDGKVVSNMDQYREDRALSILLAYRSNTSMRNLGQSIGNLAACIPGVAAVVKPYGDDEVLEVGAKRLAADMDNPNSGWVMDRAADDLKRLYHKMRIYQQVESNAFNNRFVTSEEHRQSLIDIEHQLGGSWDQQDYSNEEVARGLMMELDATRLSQLKAVAHRDEMVRRQNQGAAIVESGVHQLAHLAGIVSFFKVAKIIERTKWLPKGLQRAANLSSRTVGVLLLPDLLPNALQDGIDMAGGFMNGPAYMGPEKLIAMVIHGVGIRAAFGAAHGQKPLPCQKMRPLAPGETSGPTPRDPVGILMEAPTGNDRMYFDPATRLFYYAPEVSMGNRMSRAAYQNMLEVCEDAYAHGAKGAVVVLPHGLRQMGHSLSNWGEKISEVGKNKAGEDMVAYDPLSLLDPNATLRTLEKGEQAPWKNAPGELITQRCRYMDEANGREDLLDPNAFLRPRELMEAASNANKFNSNKLPLSPEVLKNTFRSEVVRAQLIEAREKYRRAIEPLIVAYQSGIFVLHGNLQKMSRGDKMLTKVELKGEMRELIKKTLLGIADASETAMSDVKILADNVERYNPDISIVRFGNRILFRDASGLDMLFATHELSKVTFMTNYLLIRIVDHKSTNIKFFTDNPGEKPKRGDVAFYIDYQAKINEATGEFMHMINAKDGGYIMPPFLIRASESTEVVAERTNDVLGRIIHNYPGPGMVERPELFFLGESQRQMFTENVDLARQSNNVQMLLLPMRPTPLPESKYIVFNTAKDLPMAISERQLTDQYRLEVNPAVANSGGYRVEELNTLEMRKRTESCDYDPYLNWLRFKLYQYQQLYADGKTEMAASLVEELGNRFGDVTEGALAPYDMTRHFAQTLRIQDGFQVYSQEAGVRLQFGVEYLAAPDGGSPKLGPFVREFSFSPLVLNAAEANRLSEFLLKEQPAGAVFHFQPEATSRGNALLPVEGLGRNFRLEKGEGLLGGKDLVIDHQVSSHGNLKAWLPVVIEHVVYCKQAAAEAEAKASEGRANESSLPERPQRPAMGPRLPNWMRADGNARRLELIRNARSLERGSSRTQGRAAERGGDRSSGRGEGDAGSAEKSWTTFGNANDFTLYPNPASEVVHFVGLGNQTADIWIRNAVGETVLKVELSGSENQAVDVRTLTPGMYLLQAVDRTSQRPIGLPMRLGVQD